MDKDAPGAVCTLADEELYEALRKALLPGVALVGMLTTENLGIERLVRNVVANPRISWLLLCGTDSRGHRAGEFWVGELPVRSRLNRAEEVQPAQGAGDETGRKEPP
jgi:tetrahydromethanopterin S-methyltransferase subunit A